MKSALFIVKAKKYGSEVVEKLDYVYQKYSREVCPDAKIRSAWMCFRYNRENAMMLFYANGLHKITHKVYKKSDTDYVIQFYANTISDLDNNRFKKTYMPGFKKWLERSFGNVEMYVDRADWIEVAGYREVDIYSGCSPFEKHVLHDIENRIITCKRAISYQKEIYVDYEKKGNVVEKERVEDLCRKRVKEHNHWVEIYNRLVVRDLLEMPNFK
ncbi:MAG: hypothetical protein IJA07_05510 [Agathobacter sp.]|nr:hypothetical protein [Agathobacter sp.]